MKAIKGEGMKEHEEERGEEIQVRERENNYVTIFS